MTFLIFHPDFKEYDFGEAHPFRGERVEIFKKIINEKFSDFKILKPKPASDKDLLLICKKDYIEFTKNYFSAKAKGEDFNGRFFKYHSADNLPSFGCGEIEKAARLIVGGIKLAIEIATSTQQTVITFGGLHHAKPSFGEGFCIYNDVAFGGKYLLEKKKFERVLILDTDAHAGNGTCEYFWKEKRVLFIDLHQDPKTLYPGTGFAEEIGEGEGKGFTINVPLPPLASDSSYKLVFEEIILPVVEKFKPQIILRNGGSDPHFADELTNLGLTIKGFYFIGKKVKEIKEKLNIPAIDILGSGYNLKVLPYAWSALIEGLTGKKSEIKEPIPLPQYLKKDPAFSETKKLVKKIKNIFKGTWF